MKMTQKRNSLGVVITGGSSGLGYALCTAFLAAGDRVVICGRNQQRLDAALHALRLTGSHGELYGMACDIGEPEAVKKFAIFAATRLGIIDRWINNAGTAGRFKRPLWELQSDDILETCTTNLAGSLMLCAEVVRLMECQPFSFQACYHIFNMGFSSTGAKFSRSAVSHKVSKRAVAELTHLLSRELKAAGKFSIGVHEVSPGLVLTNLLLQDVSEKDMRLLNTIADSPEKVASVLVPKIRTISGRNRYIRYQPMAMTFFRILIKMKQMIGFSKTAVADARSEVSYQHDSSRCD